MTIQTFSQKVLDEEDTLIGAEGVAPHPYEAPGSFDEEELDYEEEVETSQPDVTLDKVYSFPGLSVDTALAREEENNRKIRAEIEALRKQEALLEKRVEADNLRKQLAEQKARVASLRGNVRENESMSKSRDSAKKLEKTKAQKKQSESLKEKTDIDIVKLRKKN